MSSTDVAVPEPSQVGVLTNDQLSYIANTEFVPAGLRGNLPAILACVATGRSLGISDMAALRLIHNVDGKATLAAELMVSQARRHGHSIVGEASDTEATAVGTRGDNGDRISFTFTMEMAKRVQTRVKGGGTKPLAEKDSWKNYPEAMLWARAVSQLCRMLFSDCFDGIAYTPEEMGAEVDERGAPVGTYTDPAEGTPFSDGWEDHPPDYNPSTPVKLATAAQKKKLNVLVGKLREDSGGLVSTEGLYNRVAEMRHMADVVALFRYLNVDPADLRWRDLRDDLRKDEASALIEELSALEGSAPGSAAVAEPADSGADPTQSAAGAEELTTLLLAAGVSSGKRAEVEAAIDDHRARHDADEHLEWLRRQVARVAS